MGTTAVGAMVERHVVFGRDDLAFVVAGKPAVGEGGRPLAGGVVELVVAQSVSVQGMSRFWTAVTTSAKVLAAME